jgi:hypothetical protein
MGQIVTLRSLTLRTGVARCRGSLLLSCDPSSDAVFLHPRTSDGSIWSFTHSFKHHSLKLLFQNGISN